MKKRILILGADFHGRTTLSNALQANGTVDIINIEDIKMGKSFPSLHDVKTTMTIRPETIPMPKDYHFPPIDYSKRVTNKIDKETATRLKNRRTRKKSPKSFGKKKK